MHQVTKQPVFDSAALIQDSQHEYTLAPEWLSCWITVNGLSVYVKREEGLVVVEIYPLDRENEVAITSIGAIVPESEMHE